MLWGGRDQGVSREDTSGKFGGRQGIGPHEKGLSRSGLLQSSACAGLTTLRGGARLT